MFLLKNSLWKVSPRTNQTRLALSTTSLQDHQRLQTEDLVTALSTVTLATETTHAAHFTENDKRALRKRAQQFACTDDGKLYYVGGASSKSLHVTRVV